MTDTIPFLVASVPTSESLSYPLADHESNVIYNVSANSVKDIPQICSDSMRSFKAWSSYDLAKKRSILYQFKSNFERIENEINQSCVEIGIPQWFAGFNFSLALSMIENTIHNMATLDEGVIPASEKPEQLAIVVRQPVGPVLSISPWNAPVILTLRSILAPLAAGCSVLVKSSELSSRVSYLICKAFVETDLPRGTLQLIHTRPEDVAEIVNSVIANKNIRMVNFTGSTQVGKIISKTCGEFLKPCVLELGGKNAIIINEDVADLEAALAISVFSAWSHKGQICMCADALYVHESLYEKSLSLLVELAKNFINKDLLLNQRNHIQATKIKELVDDAVSKNAKILFNGVPNEKKHENYSSPLIITDATEDMAISFTETFGPVLTVSKFSSIDTLIDDLNGKDYGLKTSLWSSNHLKAIQYAKKIQSGGVHINSSTINDEAWLPHGGAKDSGNGRFNSRWGIESFSYLKTITVDL